MPYFPANVGLRRRLATGTAFILDAYEHGAIQWSLTGDGPQCRFDTARGGGLLLLEDKSAVKSDYENDTDFDELKRADDLAAVHVDRVGSFYYSDEEGLCQVLAESIVCSTIDFGRAELVFRDENGHREATIERRVGEILADRSRNGAAKLYAHSLTDRFDIRYCIATGG